MEIEYVTFYISFRLPKGFKNPTYCPKLSKVSLKRDCFKKELVFSALDGRCVRF